MRALFIGGSGNISAAVARLALERGIELHLLNRGRGPGTPRAHSIVADVSEPGALARAVSKRTFDVVVDFIGFTSADVERDIAAFRGRVGQYVFISSASAYQKPLLHPVVTESTPLENPFWQYSRDKIACEECLWRAHADGQLPVTIVRPSLTYDTVIPVPLGGWRELTIVERLRGGRPVVVHGDGTSLWTITHADDFAVGLVGLFGKARALGEAFHITSDELLTWDAIHEQLAAAAGCSARIVHVPSDLIAEVAPEHAGSLLGDKAWSVIFDNTKIRSLVPEFRPRVRFAEGIARTLAWFEAEPSRRAVSEDGERTIERILERYARAFPQALERAAPHSGSTPTSSSPSK